MKSLKPACYKTMWIKKQQLTLLALTSSKIGFCNKAYKGIRYVVRLKTVPRLDYFYKQLNLLDIWIFYELENV